MNVLSKILQDQTQFESLKLLNKIVCSPGCFEWDGWMTLTNTHNFSLHRSKFVTHTFVKRPNPDTEMTLKFKI